MSAGMQESALEVIARRAQDAISELGMIARAASSVHELRLPGEYDIELEVQLLDRISEVAHSISELPLVLGRGSGSSRTGGAEGRESAIKARIDVHDSPSIGAVDVPPSAVSDPIVGDAPGAPAPQAVAAPGAPSGSAS